jgi:hypothetical protein
VRRAAAVVHRRWTDVAVAVLIGVLIGGSAVYVVGRRTPAASPVPDIRVSLGVGAGQLEVANGDAVVVLPLALLNATGRAETLLAIQVRGPGAGLVPDPSGEPTNSLPVALPPGEFVDVRITISSDCSVTLRPPPSVSLVVADTRQRRYVIPVTVPDMAQIWGQTLLDGACVASP